MKKAIYFNDAELAVIFNALDVMYSSNGQAHNYTPEQENANTSAADKIYAEKSLRSI